MATIINYLSAATIIGSDVKKRMPVCSAVIADNKLAAILFRKPMTVSKVEPNFLGVTPPITDYFRVHFVPVSSEFQTFLMKLGKPTGYIRFKDIFMDTHNDHLRSKGFWLIYRGSERKMRMTSVDRGYFVCGAETRGRNSVTGLLRELQVDEKDLKTTFELPTTRLIYGSMLALDCCWLPDKKWHVLFRLKVNTFSKGCYMNPDVTPYDRKVTQLLQECEVEAVNSKLVEALCLDPASKKYEETRCELSNHYDELPPYLKSLITEARKEMIRGFSIRDHTIPQPTSEEVNKYVKDQKSLKERFGKLYPELCEKYGEDFVIITKDNVSNHTTQEDAVRFREQLREPSLVGDLRKRSGKR